MKKISIIVPVYNEEDNIELLIKQITDAVPVDYDYELICIDDGSRDSSFEKLAHHAKDNEKLVVVKLAKNTGQTAATQAGIDVSTGDILVFMDADLQNDPADITKLLNKLDEGYDVVSGWRKNRHDATVKRVLPSKIANKIITKTLGVPLHDFGCTLKAYKREVIESVRLYGEMHRFIPAYAASQGAKVAEIEVNHRARQFGVSKYGLERVIKVILDILVVKFLQSYMAKPIYIFGGFGIISFILSFIAAFWALGLKIFADTSFIATPLPLVSGMTFLVGVVCILMGLQAEVLSRTYFESQNKKPYIIKKIVNNTNKQKD